MALGSEVRTLELDSQWSSLRVPHDSLRGFYPLHDLTPYPGLGSKVPRTNLDSSAFTSHETRLQRLEGGHRQESGGQLRSEF